MIARTLMSASAAIILGLGLIHLFYTFYGTKLTPRSAALLASMMEISPVLSKETTMRKAWVGFAMLAGFVVLDKLYWFGVPFICICVAAACYMASVIMSRI